LIEAPDLGIKGLWDKLIQKTIIEKYRKKGFSKKESKEVAIQHIRSIREVWKNRRNDK